MNIKEFREIDVLGAYRNFKSIRELKNLEEIPPEYENVISDKCGCGSDIIASPSLGTMTCCDPKCFYKQASSLSSLLNFFGCTDVGDSRCFDIVYHCKVHGYMPNNSIIDILNNFDNLRGRFGKYEENIKLTIDRIKRGNLTLKDLIESLSIPGLGTEKCSVFLEYSSVKELINKMCEEGILHFFSMRGIKDLILIHNFIRFSDDMELFEKFYGKPLLKTENKIIPVCITGPVLPEQLVKSEIYKCSRDFFLDLCNNLCVVNGVRLFTIVNSSSPNSSHYVIADQPSNNRKYIEALSIQERYGDSRRFIVDSTLFINMILTEVNKWKTPTYQS